MSILIVACPQCESDDVRKVVDVFVCEKCGHVWPEVNFDD